MQTLFLISGLAYMVGGLLLALGTIATVALKVLPESFNRPMAVPTGIALIGLGISFWRDQRKTAPEAAPATTGVEQLAA